MLEQNFLSLKVTFLPKTKANVKDSVTHMMSTITKPWASPSNGTFTFIPKKLETIVGKDKMMRN